MTDGPRSARRATAVAAILAALAAAALATSGARAQLMLPGAMNGNPSGDRVDGAPAPSEAPRAPPKPIVVKPPSEDTIVGRVLAHDGAQGAMTFDKSAAGLVLSKLALTGDKISAPAKPCSLDVALDAPLPLTPTGRPAGAFRFDVPLKACPFSIDVLEGAVLVSTAAPTCDLAAADCRVSVAGLWGPSAAEIDDKRIKDLERERVRVETTMLADFRVLLKRAGKDRAAVKALAREQAGFSSAREMACRDYAQESVHGFCSTEVTEARLLALLAKFGDEPEQDEHRHLAHERVRPRPVPPQPPAANADPSTHR